jgi:hypothetical protein
MLPVIPLFTPRHLLHLFFSKPISKLLLKRREGGEVDIKVLSPSQQ